MDHTAGLAFQHAPVPLAVLAADDTGLGPITAANAALAALFDTEPEGLRGQRLQALVHPEDVELLNQPIAELASPFGGFQLRIIRGGWGVIWVAATVSKLDSVPESAVLALQDVTAWRRAEQDLAHQASHDTLTGLANRSLLIDHLERAVARLSRRTGCVAVLFCDLDGFKHLNDTFGHRFGDLVLQDVARRILSAVRREDVVVRMGGDEFVIVCESTDTGEAAAVAERVREVLEPPLRIHDRDCSVTASIGVAHMSDGAGSAEDLVRRADLAMYRAKHLGRNRVEFFAPELEEQARSRVEMVERVRSAITGGYVGVEVQPIVDLATGARVGGEALARIRQPGGMSLLPEHFLESANAAGLMVRFDSVVRETAAAWLTSQPTEPEQWISVNVSPRELATKGFANRISDLMSKHNLGAGRLVLELTENAMMDATGPSLLTLRRIRGLGCRIALDDFGSGYSSLTTLRELPVDFIKLDKGFVAGLGIEAADEAIVAAVINVSHQLDRIVIAEGVETPSQVAALKRLGCDLAQGYFFGAPNPIS